MTLFTILTTGIGGTLVGGSCLLVVFLFNLYRKQDSLLYHPVIPGLPFRTCDDNPPPFRSPRAWGLRHEELQLTTADGERVHGWFVHAEGGAGARAPTIVFFHANAGNMALRLPNVAMLAAEVPANVLIFDYRGYGSSSGVPTEAGLELDAEAVMLYLAGRADIDHGRVFLFGRSLGGAVAVRAAANQARPHERLAGIMLENTFTCIGDMVDHVMPWLSLFKPWVLRINWPTLAVLPSLPLELPVMLIAGERDALVPHAQMRALEAASRSRQPASPLAEGAAAAAALAASTTFYHVPGATHDDCAVKGGAEYVRRMRAFMDEALTRRFGAGQGLALAGAPVPVQVPAGVPPQMVPGALQPVMMAAEEGAAAGGSDGGGGSGGSGSGGSGSSTGAAAVDTGAVVPAALIGVPSLASAGVPLPTAEGGGAGDKKDL